MRQRNVFATTTLYSCKGNLIRYLCITFHVDICEIKRIILQYNRYSRITIHWKSRLIWTWNIDHAFNVGILKGVDDYERRGVSFDDGLRKPPLGVSFVDGLRNPPPPLDFVFLSLLESPNEFQIIIKRSKLVWCDAIYPAQVKIIQIYQ